MSGMNRADRAKQFMPFAALKGFEEAIEKAGKIVCERVILGEDAQAELDAALRELRLGDQVCITFYQGTEYVSPSGRVTGIDGINRRIFLSGKPIPIDDIASVHPNASPNRGGAERSEAEGIASPV